MKTFETVELQNFMKGQPEFSVWFDDSFKVDVKAEITYTKGFLVDKATILSIEPDMTIKAVVAIQDAIQEKLEEEYKFNQIVNR